MRESINIAYDADDRDAPRYLADTSALTNMRFAVVDGRLAPLIEAGLVARCGVVDLEILFTARGHQHLVDIREARTFAFPLISMSQVDFERAMDVMALLAAAGKHRATRMPDLLIAAVAERAGLTVLHYDSDFDHIADVTGQSTEWIAPRGTLIS